MTQNLDPEDVKELSKILFEPTKLELEIERLKSANARLIEAIKETIRVSKYDLIKTGVHSSLYELEQALKDSEL